MAKEAKSKKKVMVVDDEEDLCKLVRTVLDKEGYDMSCANSANAALRKLKKDPKIDLVLLDIRMPGMTPKEFIENINKTKKFSRIKIAYLTVVEFTGEEVKKLLRQKQVVDYITKPFGVKELAAKVKKILK